MGTWLPWALLAFVAILVMAMPWRRPDPHHEFMLKMLQLLEQDDSESSEPFSEQRKSC